MIATTQRPIMIRQTMTAGSNFSGVAPANGGTPVTPTLENDIWKFATATAGGLFQPSADLYSFERAEALDVVGIYLKLANQSAFTVVFEDEDGFAATIYTGTTATSWMRTAESPIVLTYTSKLKITTTGATATMTAGVILQPHRSYYY